MFPSTFFTSPSHKIIFKNINYSRKLLLPTLFYDSSTTTLAPSPNDHQLLSNNNNNNINITSSNHNNHHINFDKNVIMIISVLICAIVCSLFITSMIKCAIKCSGWFNIDPNHLLNMTNRPKLSSNNGVDKRELRTFSVVKYSAKGDIIQGLSTECVICLSEFKNNEKVKLLPKCHHAFHVKCIGKWLSSHSSCPTCRRSLVVDTCQKIVGHDDNRQAATSSSSYVEVITGEMIAINILPLEREIMVTNYT